MSQEEAAPSGGRVTWVDPSEIGPAVRPGAGREVHPDDVVARSPGAAWVLVSGEVVIYVLATRTAHVLNPAAGLMWQCLDGRDSIQTVLADVAAAIDVPAERVLAEFVPVATNLLVHGALEVIDSE